MSKIKLLDHKTIEQIAAGEVIERPSSIVKELVENSIDANSTDITIEITNGGKSFIRVSDNGDGIGTDDLGLAFKRHSTSKLSSIEDLYKITSLGFRGEALSSISHVSKIEVMTKTNDGLSGNLAKVQEGEIYEKESIGCPKGTTIIVRDLFYNIPVRKEFLRSDMAESNQISNLVYKIALGNPNISFKFIRDNKIILKTSRNNKFTNHIYSILGKEFSQNMVEFETMENNVRIKGYISNNKLYRGNRNHQYIYINGRYVNSSYISNSVGNFYKTLIPINRFPCFILFIEIDPSNIDVNIHPTKEEVKFTNEDNILSILNKSIKSTLFPSISVPQMSIYKDKVSEPDSIPLLFDFNKEDSILIKDLTSHETYFSDDPVNSKENNMTFLKEDEPLEIDFKASDEKDNKESDLNTLLSEVNIIGTVFNTYIILENKLLSKLLLIDQHAAHERIVFEKYLNEYRNESIAQQILLKPEILQLTNHEMSIFKENVSIFKDLGFDIQLFGNNSLAIRGVPLIFGEPHVNEMVYNLIDDISNIKSSYDIKLDKIMKIACSKAVKSGDKMSNLEIKSLIDQLIKVENPHTCPHGRPTILEISKKDIEKSFLRIG